MSDRAIGERAAATPVINSRRSFPRELARVEKPGSAGRSMGRDGSSTEVGRTAAGRAAGTVARTLLWRRVETEGKDQQLIESRELDRPTRSISERSAVASQGTGATPPVVGRLVDAIEQLQLRLERQQRAEGASLELRLGGRLQIQIAQGRAGLELTFTGDGLATRLVWAELPSLLAKLQERGLVVAHARVHRFSNAQRPADGSTPSNDVPYSHVQPEKSARSGRESESRADRREGTGKAR